MIPFSKLLLFFFSLFPVTGFPLSLLSFVYFSVLMLTPIKENGMTYDFTPDFLKFWCKQLYQIGHHSSSLGKNESLSKLYNVH